MNPSLQSLPSACVWACVAFGTGVLLALTGLFAAEVPGGRRRSRRMTMNATMMSRVSAGVVGAEGSWRWKFFFGLLCVLLILPGRPFFWALLVAVLPLVLGVAVAAVGASYLFYREVAWRALCRREPESAGVLSWGLGLRLMVQRMRRKRGAHKEKRRGTGEGPRA